MGDLPRIGKYEILSRLGAGGLGEVFRARPLDGKPAPLVALKRLRESFHGRSDLAQLFASEADIGLRLSHPNIVRCFEIGFDEQSHLFLVMEYVAGRSLADLLDRLGAQQLLAYELSLHIICGILTGLHCAHELTSTQGNALLLVHRDVAPDNVFLSFNGEVKLSDFGVAHLEALDGSAAHAGAFGKLPYMSPEQVLEKTIDRRSDVFSCGVIAYELLTGTHPFVVGKKNDDATIMDRIVRGKYRKLHDLLAAIPAELGAVVEQAMAVDPGRRFPTAQAMAAAFWPFFRSRANWPPVLAGTVRNVFPADYAAYCDLTATGQAIRKT